MLKLVEIGKETNRLLKRLNVLLTITNIINAVTIVLLLVIGVKLL